MWLSSKEQSEFEWRKCKEGNENSKSRNQVLCTKKWWLGDELKENGQWSVLVLIILLPLLLPEELAIDPMKAIKSGILEKFHSGCTWPVVVGDQVELQCF